MNSGRITHTEQQQAAAGAAGEQWQAKGLANDGLETSTLSTLTGQQTSNQTAPAPSKNNSQVSNNKMELTKLKLPSAQASLPVQQKRPFDIIIFAASSSVGRFLVEELALVVEKYYPGCQTPTTPAPTSAFIREVRSPFQFAQKTSNQLNPPSITTTPSATGTSRTPTPRPGRKLSVPRHIDGIRWAVAGRSAVKLNETLCRAQLSTGIEDLSNQVPVILADLNHHRSLLDMCAKTQLVINCAGPYSASGEAVIKACLETKTNYLDLCLESSFVDRMRRNYNDRAKEEGIFIINGCGFQSMSAEMGLNFMKQVADGQIEDVNIILNLSDTKANLKQSGGQTHPCGLITPGMWSSLITERSQDGFCEQSSRPTTSAKSDSSSPSDESDDSESSQTNRRPLLRKDTQSLVRDVVRLKNQSSFAWLQLFKGVDQAGKGYCLPMNTITSEESQLIRGEMTNYELRKPDLESEAGWRPIRCSSYLSMQTLTGVIVLTFWFFIFNFLVKFSLTRSLMKTFSYTFSLGNVNKKELDRDSLNHIKFCQTYLAYGTPSDDSGDPLELRDKNSKRKRELILVSRVVGPEPNHVATASYAIQAALAVVAEADHMPDRGGVMTPGAAFSETNIIYQLRRRNIKFEVLKKA